MTMLTLRRNGPQTAPANRRNVFDSWFDELFGELDRLNVTPFRTLTPYSGVDVYEDGDNLVYEVEMPGVTRDEIKVRLEDNHLIVSGEIKRNEQVEENQYLSMGRRYGQFQRTFRLPEGHVEPDSKKIKARFENGILRVSLPLKEHVKPQAIDIQVS